MEIKEQVLAIEQMKYLQDLGVDTSDASMQYSLVHDVEEPPYWELEIHEQDAISFDDEKDVIYTYTIGDLIEKLSNTIISDYEFKVTIKNHSTESVFIEDEVIEDCVTSRNPKDALYKTLCLVAKYYPELLKAETSKEICCDETDDELELTT